MRKHYGSSAKRALEIHSIDLSILCNAITWEPSCLDDLGGSRLENSNAYAISVWASWSFNQCGGEEEEEDEENEGVF